MITKTIASLGFIIAIVLVSDPVLAHEQHEQGRAPAWPSDALVSSNAADTPEPSHVKGLFISAGISWQMDLRAAIEYRFAPFFGFRLGFGVSLFALEPLGHGFTGDSLFLFYIPLRKSRIHIGCGIGVPNYIIVFHNNSSMIDIKTAFMISTGATLIIGYEFTDQLTVRVRAGEAFPFFYENESWSTRDIRMPLNLWPDILLEICYAL